ncbi:hypothetical protein GCM10022207_31600 [Streptomyces lannensis]|uniref:Uncharacterized protein n=1 Tax=Streptomyces lannensis TaxID=766498 RepID=A0ABP7K604_9ACTN
MLGEQLFPPFARKVPAAQGEGESAGRARRLDIPSQSAADKGLDSVAFQLRAAVLAHRGVCDRFKDVPLHPHPRWGEGMPTPARGERPFRPHRHGRVGCKGFLDESAM